MYGRSSRCGPRRANQAPSRAIACELAAGVVAHYGREHERAVACFMDDIEACIAHLRFPVTHRRAIRTTNLLERLFVEERRRLKIIPNAFGEKAVLKLMFGALTRAAERWRSVKVTEFECRQLTAIRNELDQEYEAQVGLKMKSSKECRPSQNIQQLSDLTADPARDRWGRHRGAAGPRAHNLKHRSKGGRAKGKPGSQREPGFDWCRCGSQRLAMACCGWTPLASMELVAHAVCPVQCRRGTFCKSEGVSFTPH
jgi:hypothetical protein